MNILKLHQAAKNRNGVLQSPVMSLIPCDRRKPRTRQSLAPPQSAPPDSENWNWAFRKRSGNYSCGHVNLYSEALGRSCNLSISVSYLFLVEVEGCFLQPLMNETVKTKSLKVLSCCSALEPFAEMKTQHDPVLFRRSLSVGSPTSQSVPRQETR